MTQDPKARCKGARTQRQCVVSGIRSRSRIEARGQIMNGHVTMVGPWILIACESTMFGVMLLSADDMLCIL